MKLSKKERDGFERLGHERYSDSFVSFIHGSAYAYMSRGARRKLGLPEYISMFYNEKLNTVGIRAEQHESALSWKLRRGHFGAATIYCQVEREKLVGHRFSAQLDEGTEMLVVFLDEGEPVVEYHGRGERR